MNKILFLISILVSITILSQSGSAYNFTDVFPDVAAKASDTIIFHQADNVLELSGMKNDSTTQNDTKFLIGSIITYTYDPLSDKYILKTKDFTAYLFFYILLIFALAGAAYVRIQMSLPKLAYMIDGALGVDPYAFDFGKFMLSLCLAAVFLVFGYWGVDFLLSLDYVSTASVTAVTLDSIMPFSDNPVAYAVMSFNVMVLSFFIIWRIYVIGFITAYILVILMLSLFPTFRPWMACILIYFLVMFFGRVILVSAAGFFMYAAQNSLPLGLAMSPAPYVVAGLGLVGIAFVLVVGPPILMWLCRRSINVLRWWHYE